MVKWWQVGGTSNADLEDAAEVAKALQPAEATWREDDLPFFDSRLIVETSAQFIAASFRIRAGADAKHESRQEEAKEGREGSVTPISRGPAAGDGQFRLRHAACCHAHHFTGLERLTTQLVPRCRPFAGQLQQTLRSICMQRGQDLEALLDSEVERFLKSRLVVMRLTDVMTPDLVAKIDSETESEDEAYGVEGSGIFNATAKGLRSKGDLGGRRGPSIHPLGQPIKLSRHALAKKLQQMSLHAITGASVGRAAGGVAEAARRAVKEERRQRAKEKGMRLFEHRFFRAFTIALGQSLFGEREDLVFRFEVAALNVLHTYQGELPLALHSLMGWLPAQVSKSLFVVLTGLPALVAAKQSLEKFGMLLNCVNCIASGSGRYVFVSTPSWYLPLSARLFRRLGRLHEIRETSLATGGRPITSVQAVWPSPAEPQEVIAAVDATWGGRIAGQRAALGLCGGVEAMGEWVLRMTMGCQGLLMRALEVLQSFAPSFEQAYDELVAEGEFANLEVPSDPSLARCLADCAAEAVRLRAHAARQAAKSLRAERLAECDDALPSRRPKAKFRKSVTETVPSGGRERRTSLADVESDATEVGRRRPGERPNLLAQLQRGDIVRDEAAQHLRRSVKVGVGSGVRLPVGSGHMVGRIPIHDSPKLRPDVAAPIVEDVSLPEPVVAKVRPMLRTMTAPQLRHPKSFAEQLAEMAALSKRSHQTRRRAASAPAAVDTQDFDAGNVMKNTAVALALQEEISKVLSMECSEGPLNLFWRQGRGYAESQELMRLRLNCGALLLFAALRNALPGNELPLKHFAPTDSIGVKDEDEPAADSPEPPPASVSEKEAASPPKPKRLPLYTSSLADGAFAMGFSVIFHSMPSSHFARTSPLGAAFHLGLPQAMLEPQVLQDVLTQRVGDTMTWSSGSLLVFLSKYILEEEHVASRYWTRLAGWLQQRHQLFFSSSCCLRVLLAFELMNHYYALRPEDKPVRLKDIFPFLRNLCSRVKDLQAKLDMCAEYCQRPLLHAPKIAPALPGAEHFEANFAEWGKEFIAGGLAVDAGVPLMDFAKWVGHLKPGRIVYASPNASSDWDLLLRLNWSVVIISFHASRNQEVSGEQLFRLHRRCVGQPSWWGKRIRLISHIVMADRLAFELEALFPSTLQCVEIPENCAVPGGAATEGKAPKTARRKAGTTEDLDEEEEDDDEDEEEEVPPVPGQDLGEIFCIEETEVCDFLIRPGSELLLCKAPEGLERLLGPIAHAVLGHRRAFDAQISQEFSGELLREAAQRRAELNRARWSQDKSRLACRQPLPTASEKQLVFNFEALRRILDQIYDHTTQMQRLTSEINSDSEDNSVLGSFVSSLPPIKPGSRGSARDDDDDDSKSSKSSKSGTSSTSSLTASSQMAPSLNPSLMRARDNSISDEEELHLAENPPARRRASLHWVELRQSAKLLLWAKQKRRRGVMASLPEMEGAEEAVTSSIRLEEAAPDHKLVHFEEGTVEPLRTTQRREWRPPTPHPQQSPEAARRTNPHKAKERFQKAARRGLKFDWLGWDS